jgi:phospholipase D1/2
LWPGVDYCNPREKDFTDVRDFARSDLDKNKEYRLPWHDIALMVKGEIVIDLTRHFI